MARRVIAAECLGCGETRPVDEFEPRPRAPHGIGPSCRSCRARVCTPDEAVEIAHDLAGALCRRRRCWPLFDDFVGAGLAAFASFTFDPTRNVNAHRHVAWRMQMAMIDHWRSVYGRHGRSQSRAGVPLSLDAPLDDGGFCFADVLADPVDEIERAERRVLVETLRARADERGRAVIDGVLAGKPQKQIAAECGVTNAAIHHRLRAMRKAAIAVGAA